jgi:cystathionine beta-lyase/cystathionine gamma-synthase
VTNEHDVEPERTPPPDTSPPDKLHPDTVAIRAGRAANDGSLSTPLWSTSVWTSPSLTAARRSATGTRADRFYTRYGNPTVRAFEDAVAALEHAEASLAFSSGMGAVASVLYALCTPGDHVVAQRQIYGGTLQLLQMMEARFGIDVTWVDVTEPGAFAAAVRPGKTVVVANPRVAVADLRELGAIRGPFTVVDGTLAPPVIQRPLEHGVSLVVHSATKGIAGHNDATLGVVSGERDVVDELWRYSVLHGASASPHDALNALRGIRTLAVRTARQCETALALARHLATHPAVERVHHPGLDDHPQHAVAAAQMDVFGSLFSFEVLGGADAAARVCERVQVAQLATSLGGPETLVTVPAMTTHVGLSPEDRELAGVTPGLVRMSVGLEHLDDLRSDLDRALATR